MSGAYLNFSNTTFDFDMMAAAAKAANQQAFRQLAAIRAQEEAESKQEEQ